MAAVPSFYVNQGTLAELGWPRVIDALAGFSRTPKGGELCGRLPFLDGLEDIRGSFVRIRDARELNRRELVSPNGTSEDIRPSLARVEKSGVLTGLEFLAIAKVIDVAGRVSSFFRTHELISPALAGMAARLPRLSPLSRRISDTVDEGGVLKDSASEALNEYRSRARSLHQSIQGQIKALIDDPKFAEYLREAYYSVRNDRYVVPLIASFRSKVPGIVHNASQTGQTIFVEPQQIIGLGNELSIALSLAKEEEERILTELSQDLMGYLRELHDTVDGMASIDVVEACARLSDVLDAAEPEISKDDSIDLPELRHPLLLLQGKKVVANAVHLGSEERALVVSGPNAGGKTVTISAMGLCALMVRAGLPIPAGARAKVTLVKGVGSVIGDAQDLSRDLSTFSAHLARLKDVLDLAVGGWLVLIDEICAGTDPSEGSAIAVAVLERLVERHARVAVTTHLDEVKALGVSDGRFVNARMSFDPDTLLPTFSLQQGLAGMSNALDMARQCGLPSMVIDRAREHLETGSRLSVALSKLDATQFEVDALRRELREREAALEGARQDVEERLRAAEKLKMAAKKSAYDEVAAEFASAAQEASSLIAEIQASQSMRQAQQLQASIKSGAEAVEKAKARVSAADEARDEVPAGRSYPIAVGARVKHTTLGQTGLVLELDGNDATLAIGALKTRARISDLVALPPKQDASKPPGKPDGAAQREKVSTKLLEHAESRLDLRGMRVDDAERELKQFIDLLMLKGPPSGLVVHGHGTGALRKLVREVLEHAPEVVAYRRGDRHEGGEGVTLLEVGEG